MINIKSPRELELMKEAGRIVALVHQEMAKAVKVGTTTNILNDIAEKIIVDHGATPSFKGYGGFPAAICASVNEVLIHGFPNNKPLKEGDVVSIDVGACYKGYHGDSAWTYPVGNISDEDKKLLEVTEESLYQGLSKVKAGIHLSDVSHAIQEYVEKFGYSVPIEYTGHGIGSKLHEDPPVPNYGIPGRGPILKKGMCIAVEPMVNVGSRNTKTLSDGWTVKTVDGKNTAHFEHTIIVTEDGYEITTKL